MRTDDLLRGTWLGDFASTDLHVDLESLSMAIRGEAFALLGYIHSAVEEHDLAVSGALAEGVVRGMELVKALSSDEIKGLYALFETAVNTRLAQLMSRA